VQLIARPAELGFGRSGLLCSRVVRDANVNVIETDLGKYAKAMQQLSALLDAADPDLSAFRRRGGKLIMKVNTTDYTVNPRSGRG
jgi:feruloyl esterase